LMSGKNLRHVGMRDDIEQVVPPRGEMLVVRTNTNIMRESKKDLTVNRRT